MEAVFMIYRQFNNYIKEHFFKPENIGETVVLSVDETVVDGFCKNHDIKEDILREEIRRLFSKDWSFALGKEANLHGQQEFLLFNSSEAVVNSSDIPLFFGFIAIQVYIASLMEESDNLSDRQYNPRLCEYLGYGQNIQMLENQYANYQETIWNDLRDWAHQEGFEFEIPSKRKYAGRYVQYPLCHCLLNAEDLKHLPNLFQAVGLKPFESICFEDFKHLVSYRSRGEGLTNHFYKVKERLELSNTVKYLYHQVYNFYVNWRGDNSCPVITEGEKNTNEYDISAEKQNVILYANQELTKLTVLNDDSEGEVLSVLYVDRPNMFIELEDFYKKFHKTRLFLVKNESNGEWEDERFLDERKDFIVILDRHKSNESLRKNLSKEFNEVDNKHYWIYKISSEHGKVNALKYFYTKSKKNYNIQNGLKLSRKVWMVGAGPEIVFDSYMDVWLDRKKIEFKDEKYIYDCRELEVGSYELRVKNFTPYKIIIEEPKVMTVERSTGWHISKEKLSWEIDSSDYNVVGLHYNFPCLIENASVLEWCSAIKGDKVDINKSIVINAIKRSKHGI